MNPENLRFAETHEWACLGGGTVVVGLSAYAVEQLGDIVYIELPAAGAVVAKGKPFGVIESVKAASDLYAPVTGSVVEVNSDIAASLDAFKTDPYGAAWLIKVSPAKTAELDSLMNAKGYDAFCKAQGEH